MNPVIFPDLPESEKLVVYSKSLSEFNWQDRLVGLTESGILYAGEKIPRKGYYEFHPRLLEWPKITELKTSSYVSVPGIAFGLVALALAYFAFMAGWVKHTHTGPGMITIPLICGLGGAIFILGARRNRIVATSDDATYRWISPPLAYRRTLSLCAESSERCRAHGVRVLSHCEPKDPRD